MLAKRKRNNSSSKLFDFRQKEEPDFCLMQNRALQQPERIQNFALSFSSIAYLIAVSFYELQKSKLSIEQIL